MATKYFMAAGGNWADDTKWSTISSAGPNDTTRAVAGDDVILDAGSGNCTLNAAAACQSLNCTGYVGTLAFGAHFITVSGGNITLPNGMSATASGGGISFNSAGTVTGGIATFPYLLLTGTGAVTLNGDGTTWTTLKITGGSKTVTLGSALACTTLNIAENFGNTTFAGAYGITIGTLLFGFTGSVALTFVSGQTVTVTTALLLAGTPAPAATFTVKASTASSAAYLTFQGTAANCKVFGMTFTDIDASGSAQGIVNWYGGTLTRTSGITNRTSADVGGGGGRPAFGDRSGGKL